MNSLIQNRALSFMMLLSLALGFLIVGAHNPQVAHADESPTCSIDKTVLARGEVFTVTYDNIDPNKYREVRAFVWARNSRDFATSIHDRDMELKTQPGVTTYQQSLRILPSATPGKPWSESNPDGYDLSCSLRLKNGTLEHLVPIPVEITNATKPHPDPQIVISNVTESGEFSLDISPVYDSAQFPISTGEKHPAANLEIAWSVLNSSDTVVCGSEISHGLPSGKIRKITRGGLYAYPRTVHVDDFGKPFCSLSQNAKYKLRIWIRNAGYEGFDYVAPGVTQEFFVPGRPLLTVTNGSGSGRYAPGEAVPIKATCKDGFEFIRWNITSGSAVITDVYSPETTVTMPDEDVGILAWCNALEYSLTVVDGSGSGTHPAEASVPIKAAPAPDGMVFDKWVVVSGEPQIADVTQAETTLTMPAGDVEVKATYKAKPTESTLTVVGGTGSGTYPVGEKVPIYGDDGPDGMGFAGWVVVSGSPVIEKPRARSTTVTIPEGDAVIKATYHKVFSLTVTGGEYSGLYAEGEHASLTSDPAPDGMVFDKWVIVSGQPEIVDVNAAVTTLVMPAGDVEVKATYKAKPAESTLTVVGGTGSGTYEVGEQVPIFGDPGPDGMGFAGWVVVSGSPVIENPNARWTTVTIPEGDAVIEATYVKVFRLTVTGGGPSGPFAEGELASLTCDPAPDGMVFDKWVIVSGQPEIEDVNAAETILVMPAGDVEVKATYKAIGGSVPDPQPTDKPGSDKTPGADPTKPVSGSDKPLASKPSKSGGSKLAKTGAPVTNIALMATVLALLGVAGVSTRRPKRM